MAESTGAPPNSTVAPQVPPPQPATAKLKDTDYDELMYDKPYVAKMQIAPPPAAPIAPALGTKPPAGMMKKQETRPRPPLPPPRQPPATGHLSYMDMRGGSGDHSADIPPGVALPLNKIR